MPLPFIRVVCRDCEEIISDGWPPRSATTDASEPEGGAPLVPLVISRQICRQCEAEAELQDAEDRRRGTVNA